MIIDSPIISGSYAASGSLNQLGNVVISGSLTITEGITGSISGSADSASYAATASYVNTLSQKLLPSTNGTYDLGSSSLYWGDAYLDYVYADSGVRIASGNAVSWGSNDYIDLVPVNTAPFFNRFQVILNGSSSLVMNTLGSTFLNRVTAPSFTGSLFGTASFADNATSASYAATASYISGSGEGVGFPFSGSAVITGSLQISNLTGSGVRYLVADESGSITAQSASAALKATQAFTSTAGQTTFSVTNGYATGYVDVFINGSKLSTAEFTDTSGTNIVLATGSFDGDTVEVVKYTPAAGVTNNVLRQLTTLTGSAGQTVFSASYTPGLLDIFYNGSRLSTSDYTANNGTYFTLATGSVDGDILDVLVYSYQVGAFNGIGGQGVTNQLAFFNTTSSITGSNSLTISGDTLVGTASYALNADTLDGAHLSTLATTGSNTFTSAQYVSNTSTPIGFTDTASVYTDGGIRATKTSYFSSSVYIGGDLIIFGSQSVNYITSSQLNIADNIITVNTSSPAVRFGGIAVQDSGSLATGLTGSLLWDSQNNHWIYTNPSGSSYSGGMLISGPRNTGSMGDEQGTTFNALMKGMGGDHITSSGIFESSSFVGIGTSTPLSPLYLINNDISIYDATVDNGQESLGSTFSLRNNDTTVTGSFSQINMQVSGDSGRALGRIVTIRMASATSDMAFVTENANTKAEKMRITAAGNVGIGLINPSYTLDVSGSGNFRNGLTVTGSLSTNDLALSNMSLGPNNIDNTQGSWLIQEGQDDLFIINQLSGKKYKFNLIEIK
jgi:hypothetical protein